MSAWLTVTNVLHHLPGGDAVSANDPCAERHRKVRDDEADDAAPVDVSGARVEPRQ
jgi:hypothetical protein